MEKTDNIMDKVKIYLDDDPNPFVELDTPSKILFDTTKIQDGKHTLKFIAKSSSGKEGIKTIPFEVRNGPSISVIGLEENQVVEDKLPINVNAYGSERKEIFVVKGSENPKGIPIWVWVILLLFIGWGLHYLVLYWTDQNYISFF
ncbi:cytochrome C [uncultured Croceitalea sp.]|uniref:cytochrome C n=1 Tax=uncultured Croceitalea sp. TaxID=1798908 RepID=UPI0033057074